MAHNGGDGEVSTIFVGGFPPDVNPRELDNLCRFMPGFVQSNVITTKGTTLFAMFDCASNARTAITALNGYVFDRIQPGEPMRAQMARNNMRSSGAAPAQLQYGPAPSQGRGWSGGSIGAPAGQPPPPAGPHPSGIPVDGGPPGKRPRIPEDPSNVDTVASVGAAEAGFDENSLRGFFESLPGYLEFKGNPRMGGGFAKFASSTYASQAVDTASIEGVPCQLAKSSMGASGGGGGGARQYGSPTTGPIAPVSAFPTHSKGGMQGGGGGKGAGGKEGGKRPRIPEDPTQVDTVASVGAREAGYDQDALQAFFQQLPGFVAFKPNPRMGGGFAKFASSDMAVSAMQMAQEQGLPAEMARSSMSVMSA